MFPTVIYIMEKYENRILDKTNISGNPLFIDMYIYTLFQGCGSMPSIQCPTCHQFRQITNITAYAYANGLHECRHCSAARRVGTKQTAETLAKIRATRARTRAIEYEDIPADVRIARLEAAIARIADEELKEFDAKIEEHQRHLKRMRDKYHKQTLRP